MPIRTQRSSHPSTRISPSTYIRPLSTIVRRLCLDYRPGLWCLFISDTNCYKRSSLVYSLSAHRATRTPADTNRKDVTRRRAAGYESYRIRASCRICWSLCDYGQSSNRCPSISPDLNVPGDHEGIYDQDDRFSDTTGGSKCRYRRERTNPRILAAIDQPFFFFNSTKFKR